MSDKTEYIKPKKFFEVFNEISETLYEKIFEQMDKDLFYDRQKFIDKNTMQPYIIFKYVRFNLCIFFFILG